jgi:hypothetical protein
VWWDADQLRELLDGFFADNPPREPFPPAVMHYDIRDGTTTKVLEAVGCSSNNWTKNNPVLSGDIFGDWREEAIWRTSDSQYLRIYTTTIPATNRLYTFLQDPQYRLALVWQNVTYNQPPWPSFYVGPGMKPPPKPNIAYPVTLWANITAKTGPQGARAWTLSVANTGTAPASAAVVKSFSLTQTAGAACTPVVTSPLQFPIQLGDLAPGAAATVNITIDFSSCGNVARFRVTAPLSAMDGAATSLLVRNNEFR